jgi:hypothetical protein
VRRVAFTLVFTPFQAANLAGDLLDGQFVPTPSLGERAFNVSGVLRRESANACPTVIARSQRVARMRAR